jgi:ribonuclease HI
MPAVSDFIDPAQKGFLAGKQGSDHILEVNSFFYEGFDTNSDRFLFLLDTAKAFDSIDHSWIKYILKLIGFPKWFLNYIKGALSNVSVSPFFGKKTSISIDIERGVKQGCPLSPLIFILAYDPLLFFLRTRTNNTYYAFADDLATTSLDIYDIFPALNIINDFSSISGLGVNKDKSLILTTAPLSRYDTIKNILASSPWPDLPLKNNSSYLGIPIGHDISLDDIWRSPMDKALNRIHSCSSFVRSLSLSKRILFVNVFIVSLFSYVALFYILPTGLWKKIKRAISKLVIPFNGCGFSYESLVCADLLYKVSPALKDVWAFNISLLTVRSPLFTSSCNYSDLPYINVKNTRFISRHRDAAAVDFWRGRHLPDGKLLPLSNGKSSNVYKSIISDVYLDEVLAHYNAKVSNFISASSPPLLSPSNVLLSISNNLRSIKTPPFLKFFHLKLIYNALPTSRRCRHQNRISVDLVDKCFFCGIDQDSIVHIYSSCVIVNNSRYSFLKRLKLDPSPFVLAPSGTVVPQNESSRAASHSYSFPKLRSFLLSILPPSLPPSSIPHSVLSPLCYSFLYGINSHLFLPILCFNFAVWNFRRPANSSRLVRSNIWLSNRIVELASNNFDLVSSLNCSIKSKISANASVTNSNLEDAHFDIIAKSPPDSVICYTDGSASPNPGPCGGAASIFIKKDHQIRDVGIPLGHGTNNIGELAALFICINELISLFPSLSFSSAIIFCDSRYVIHLLSSSRLPSANTGWVNALRSAYKFATNLFHISLRWVKGHVDIGGNVRADFLAKCFAPLTAPSGFLGVSDPICRYYSCSSPWPFGFSFESVPLALFRPTSFNVTKWCTSPVLLSSPSPLSPSLPHLDSSEFHSYRPSFYDTSSETLDFKHLEVPSSPITTSFPAYRPEPYSSAYSSRLRSKRPLINYYYSSRKSRSSTFHPS